MRFAQYLEQIENVGIFPTISLVIFSVIFAIVLLYAFMADGKRMDDNANSIMD